MTARIYLDESCIDQVISERRPFVKLLSVPTKVEYELAPGWLQYRWEALAQVNECVAIIEVKISEFPN